MAIDAKQLKEVVVLPALNALGLSSLSAVNLLIGTAAQETNMGTYLIQKQIGLRGGIGIYQQSAASHVAIWERMVKPDAAMRAKISLYLGYSGMPQASRLATDLALATIMARLYYYAINVALPDANDLPGLAKYYKRYWNTEMGKATEEQFIDNYKRYVNT